MKSAKKILIDDCYIRWVKPDGTICPNTYSVCMNGDLFIEVMYDKLTIYREHRAFNHISEAWRILSAGRFGKWKTTAMLITLRNALRERYAQCMPIDMPKDGISERELKAWFRMARAYDTIHHGVSTF